MIAATAVVALAAACSDGLASPPYDGDLPIGTWGGNNSGMMVGDTAMHLHIGCTFGDVSGRIPLSASGQFDVSGSYMLHAFPIAVGPAVPARFVGRVDGATATITVTVNDTVAHQSVVLGPVTVKWGTDPQMGPCPICRRPTLARPPARATLWSRLRAALSGRPIAILNR